ncbi:MAG: universal stress protein [Nitrospira sp.]|nr:MAG: universal stress protein [Nitrospira sp.]
MRILCAVDGSHASQIALDAMGTLYGPHADEVIILHVVDTSPFRGLRAVGPTGRTRVAKARAALDRTASELLRRATGAVTTALHQSGSAPKATISSALMHGRPAAAITAQAERRAVDVIVLGSRRITDDRGFLLGSVARKVLAGNTRSVFVVKTPLSSRPQVVLAIDGSPPAHSAVCFLRRWPLPENAHLTVLSVVPPVLDELAATVLPLAKLAHLAKPAAERTKRLVAQTRESFLGQGAAVSGEVLDGRPGPVIIKYLEKAKADLVVMGSRGLTGEERFVLGSVAEDVVHHAPCSALIVKR